MQNHLIREKEEVLESSTDISMLNKKLIVPTRYEMESNVKTFLGIIIKITCANIVQGKIFPDKDGDYKLLLSMDTMKEITGGKSEYYIKKYLALLARDDYIFFNNKDYYTLYTIIFNKNKISFPNITEKYLEKEEE